MVVESFLTSNLPSPDVGTAYLASYLKKYGHDVLTIDAAGEGLGIYTPIESTSLYVHGICAEAILTKIPQNTEYIGISCMLTNCWIHDLYIIRRVSKSFPKAKIIIGGEHATAAYEYIIKHHSSEISACVLGEGEETIVDLLDAFNTNRSLETVKGISFKDTLGKIQVTQPRKRLVPSTLPWPDWSDSPLENYFKKNQGINSNAKKSMIMLASRGCPYACGFCTNDFMWQEKWISREPQDVVLEIKHYIEKYNIEHIDFVDLTILIRKDWMHTFCDLLINENLNITWAIPVGTRTESMDKELLIKMRKSGFLRVLYAAESGSDDTLVKIEKKLVVSHFIEVVKETLKVGVYVKVNFIIGFPDQGVKQLIDSYKLLLKMAFYGVNDLITLVFVPYPSTKLYKELELNYDFSSPDFRIPLNNNISSPISWTKSFSNSQIRIIMIFFNASFYGIQYIIRPIRIIQSLTRILITKKPLTNFESIVFNYFKKKEFDFQKPINLKYY
jgi:radical SAM superfamily enzyme YgiQ (UPF0313 family)